MFLVFLSFIACSDKQTDSGFVDGEEVNNSNCPNAVPEEFRYTWDCLNVDCGGSTVYRLGSGSSLADGTITITEQWFVFDGIQPCIDTFEISGIESDINPQLLNFPPSPHTNRGFEVMWKLTDSQCNLLWKSTFADQESDEQEYFGYLFMDTHSRTSFNEEDPLERYEDNFVVVGAAPVNSAENEYAPIPEYASGSATPTTADTAIGVPEEYSWSSSGSCYE